MRLLDALVEQRIAAAAARGEFDDLPGAGAPQALDDDLLVPEEVRVANRILKNAGFVPPAVEQLRALRNYGCVITQRLRIEGFIVVDWFDQYPEALREVAALHAKGQLKWRYHDVDGLEHAVDAVRLLFQGRNHGKMLVRI